MILYLFFLILSFLPLVEGELLGIGRFLLLTSCLPLAIYLYRRHVKARPLHAVFLAFLFFATLSTIFSSVFSRSFNSLLLYFSYFIYFLAAQNLAGKKRRNFKELLIVSALFSSLVLCLLSLYLLFSQQPPPFSSMNLIFANFGHNHLIDYLIFAFPLSLILFFQERGKFKKTLFLLLNLVFLAGFIFSFSRGGVLMAVLIIILFEVFFWQDKKLNKQNKTIIKIFGLSLGLLLALVLSLNIVGGYYFKKGNRGLLNNFILKKAFRDLPILSRLDYWRQAFLAFKDKPLLGWGLDNFRYASFKYQKQPRSWSWYAHNHFFQTLAETGIFGGLSFLILIFMILRKTRPWQSSDSIKTGLKIGLIVSIIHSFFDYDWQFPSVFLLFWVAAGFLTSKKKLFSGNKHSTKIFNLGVLILSGIIFLAASLELAGNLFLFFGAENKDKNNNQKAERFFRKSLSIWPFKIENWQTVFTFYQDRGERQKALFLLKKLIIIEPLNSKNYKLMADFYNEKNDWVKAADYYQKSIKLDSMDSFDISLKLIDIWQAKKIKNPQELYSTLANIEKLKGKHCLLKCLGFDNEEKILKLLLQLIKSNQFSQLNQSQQARVYYWLAVLTTYQLDWNQDIGFLRQAVTLENKKEYRYFLKDLLLIQKIEQAFKKQDFKTVKNLSKSFESKQVNCAFHEKFYLSKVYYFLGEIEFINKNWQLSEMDFKTSKKINPWQEESYLSLAKIYKEKGEKKKAKEILLECVNVDQWKNRCQKELEALNGLR